MSDTVKQVDQVLENPNGLITPILQILENPEYVDIINGLLVQNFNSLLKNLNLTGNMTELNNYLLNLINQTDIPDDTRQALIGVVNQLENVKSIDEAVKALSDYVISNLAIALNDTSNSSIFTSLNSLGQMISNSTSDYSSLFDNADFQHIALNFIGTYISTGDLSQALMAIESDVSDLISSTVLSELKMIFSQLFPDFYQQIQSSQNLPDLFYSVIYNLKMVSVAFVGSFFDAILSPLTKQTYMASTTKLIPITTSQLQTTQNPVNQLVALIENQNENQIIGNRAETGNPIAFTEN